MNTKVICVGIKHPGNLGAIARLCDNFDLEQLILVSPECKVNDIAYERATKSRRYLDNILIVDTLIDAKKHVDVLIALSARVGSGNSLTRSSLPITKIITDLNLINGSIGLVLGREDNGLSNDEVNDCDFLANIPLPGQNPVMNISHALSVVLWELYRNNDPHNSPHRLMKREEKDAFLKMLNQILIHTWIEEDKYYGVERVFTSILSRALVSQREANALIGTLRGILRSLEGNHPPWDNCGK